MRPVRRSMPRRKSASSGNPSRSPSTSSTRAQRFGRQGDRSGSCRRGPRADGRASTAPSRRSRRCAARSDGRSDSRRDNRRARSRSRHPAECCAGSHAIRRSIDGDLVGLRGDVLLAPSSDLPRVVVARLAVVARARPRRRRRDAVARAHRPCRRTSRRARPRSRREGAAAERRGLHTQPMMKNGVPITLRRRTSAACGGTGTSVAASARITRYSRSTACADGSSWPGGFLRST